MFYHDPLTKFAVQKAFGVINDEEIRILDLPAMDSEHQRLKDDYSLKKMHYDYVRSYGKGGVPRGSLEQVKGARDDLEQARRDLVGYVKVKEQEQKDYEQILRQRETPRGRPAPLKLDRNVGGELEEQKRRDRALQVPQAKAQKNALFGFSLLSAAAMAVSYSRSKSLLRAFGASFVALPYLLYVGYDVYIKKDK